ncbi:MAG: hypothetical protein F9K25_05180 [Candidatus Contendobacter sp.]|nr:MAG: hypothetical protein F9K25_05180 [Candidatus Contendobacter sp.]
MLLQTVDFRDYAASRIAKTLLSVFFNRGTLFGSQFTFHQFVFHAYKFANQLEEQKREDDRLNELALTLLEGMLFGFYDNRKENKNWSSMVHASRIPLFIRDAYRLAELMVALSGEMAPETNEAPNDESAESKPAMEDSE